MVVWCNKSSRVFPFSLKTSGVLDNFPKLSARYKSADLSRFYTLLVVFHLISNMMIVKNCSRIFMLYRYHHKGLSNFSRRVGNTLTRRTPTGHTGQSYLIAIIVDTAWYIWFFLYRCKKRETKMNMTHEVINIICRWCAWNCDAKVCFLLKFLNFKLDDIAGAFT